jgi:hypothetical protein
MSTGEKILFGHNPEVEAEAGHIWPALDLGPCQVFPLMSALSPACPPLQQSALLPVQIPLPFSLLAKHFVRLATLISASGAIFLGTGQGTDRIGKKLSERSRG